MAIPQRSRKRRSATRATWTAWILARRRTRIAYVLGALGNLAIAALWVMSRSAGVPLGSEPWTPEPVHVIDVLATVEEVAIAIGAFALVRPLKPPRKLRFATYAPTTWFIVVDALGLSVWQSIAHPR